MQPIPYAPFKGLLGTEKDISRLLSEGWPLMPFFSEDSRIDIYIEEDKLVVEAVLPSFKKEEVKIITHRDGLEITAAHTEKEEKTTKRTYLLQESSRSYRRYISLPFGADTRKVEASFDDGKLIAKMPFTKDQESNEVAIA